MLHTNLFTAGCPATSHSSALADVEQQPVGLSLLQAAHVQHSRSHAQTPPSLWSVLPPVLSASPSSQTPSTKLIHKPRLNLQSCYIPPIPSTLLLKRHHHDDQPHLHLQHRKVAPNAGATPETDIRPPSAHTNITSCSSTTIMNPNPTCISSIAK